MTDKPVTGEGLRNQVRSSHEQLEAALARVPEVEMSRPQDSAGWSFKDALAHLTYWEQFMLRRVEDRRNGRMPEQVTVAGESLDQAVDRRNAEVFRSNRDRSMAEIRIEFDRSYAQVLEVLATLTEADLQALLFGPGTTATQYDNIRSNTFEHYREHTETLLNWLKGRP